jgi:soluble lytic murein transglycosylase
MLAALTLLAAVTADPRPALVELQLQSRTRDALTLTQREIQEHPDAARQMGLDFLRGHLLHQAGEAALASEAFGAALANTPDLALYSRYRMALEQAEMSHPEVAAGLVAWVVGNGPGSPIAPDAVRLFTRSLAHGGDCRLLRGIVPEKLATPQRRSLLLSQADCAIQGGLRELARNLLVKLLEENRKDDPGRAAAERLAGLVSDGERGRTPMLLGMTFNQHREFGRALGLLQRSLGGGDSLSRQDAQETHYLQAHAQLDQQRYGPAALLFGQIANQARSIRERSRALYQQGRSYELMGEWRPAVTSFQMAYLADPSGDWGAPALLSALRLDWRSGDEAAAATLFYTLAGRPEWYGPTLRAGLFMAASDIVRGRGDRARAWLDHLLPETADDRLELAYWRGRLAELDPAAPAAAVNAYLEALRTDPYHPLSRLARARLAAEPLAHAAAQEGRRLAASGRPQDLYGAWLLLGSHEAGQAARKKLMQLLAADRTAAPFVRLAEVRISDWPLWKKPLLRPEDKLLALGLWHEGAPAVRDQFPVTEPSLALTGSLFLDRGGEHALSIQQAEMLRKRTPARVPLAIQPRVLHVVLYPFPYREILLNQARPRGVDPNLLAALIREESRFDRNALSPEAARGLVQLTLPAAQRIAALIDLRLDPDDLFRPEVSAALGATALAALHHEFNGSDPLSAMAVSAYKAGAPQALLWRSYCNSPGQLDEYFTKMGSDDTRAYLRRVLTSRAHYEELY